MDAQSDGVLRTMTDDGNFRVITARTTDTVRGALSAQGVSGAAARYFGDLLTGVVLVRETMAPQLRVQGILRAAKRSGTFVADSHPTGCTRGLVTARGRDDSSEIDLGRGAVLQLMRTLNNGQLHQGFVEMPASGGISEALMSYMHVSEQVTSMAAVGTVFDEEQEVLSAGGYLVQLLPGAEREPLLTMSERIERSWSIDKLLKQHGCSPTRLMKELLDAMPFSRVGESDVRFECWCSKVRVMTALATLPRPQVQSLVDDGEVLEISCDYCNREYRVSPSELRGLVGPN